MIRRTLAIIAGLGLLTTYSAMAEDRVVTLGASVTETVFALGKGETARWLVVML